jgi:hypothetical protein
MRGRASPATMRTLETTLLRRCDDHHEKSACPRTRRERPHGHGVGKCVGPMVGPRIIDRRRLWTKSRIPRARTPSLGEKGEPPAAQGSHTDLKGGSRLAAVACCTKTHHCAAFNFGAAVINPAGSPSRGGHRISEPTSHGTEHPRAPCLLKTAHELDESGRRRIQAVGSRCDGQHKNALIPKLRENRPPDRAVPWCVGPMVEPRVTDRRRLWTTPRVQRPRTPSWH